MKQFFWTLLGVINYGLFAYFLPKFTGYGFMFMAVLFSSCGILIKGLSNAAQVYLYTFCVGFVLSGSAIISYGQSAESAAISMLTIFIWSLGQEWYLYEIMDASIGKEASNKLRLIVSNG